MTKYWKVYTIIKEGVFIIAGDHYEIVNGVLQFYKKDRLVSQFAAGTWVCMLLQEDQDK